MAGQAKSLKNQLKLDRINRIDRINILLFRMKSKMVSFLGQFIKILDFGEHAKLLIYPQNNWIHLSHFHPESEKK